MTGAQRMTMDDPLRYPFGCPYRSLARGPGHCRGVASSERTPSSAAVSVGRPTRRAVLLTRTPPRQRELRRRRRRFGSNDFLLAGERDLAQQRAQLPVRRQQLGRQLPAVVQLLVLGLEARQVRDRRAGPGQFGGFALEVGCADRRSRQMDGRSMP